MPRKRSPCGGHSSPVCSLAQGEQELASPSFVSSCEIFFIIVFLSTDDQGQWRIHYELLFGYSIERHCISADYADYADLRRFAQIFNLLSSVQICVICGYIYVYALNACR